jgi:uncharacterized membrane protein
MYHGWNGGGWARGGYALGFPWGGLVMGLIGIAIIVLLIVLIVRSGANRKPNLLDSKEKGIDILIERYTRGEIDGETFKAMKAELDARI